MNYGGLRGKLEDPKPGITVGDRFSLGEAHKKEVTLCLESLGLGLPCTALNSPVLWVWGPSSTV
jgi:hypothetical protein